MARIVHADLGEQIAPVHQPEYKDLLTAYDGIPVDIVNGLDLLETAAHRRRKQRRILA